MSPQLSLEAPSFKLRPSWHEGSTITATTSYPVTTTQPGSTIVQTTTQPGSTIVSTAPGSTVVSTYVSTYVTTRAGSTVTVVSSYVSTYVTTAPGTTISVTPSQSAGTQTQTQTEANVRNFCVDHFHLVHRLLNCLTELIVSHLVALFLDILIPSSKLDLLNDDHSLNSDLIHHQLFFRSCLNIAITRVRPKPSPVRIYGSIDRLSIPGPMQHDILRWCHDVLHHGYHGYYFEQFWRKQFFINDEFVVVRLIGSRLLHDGFKQHVQLCVFSKLIFACDP
ncbi:uncharacterized protein LTR77_003357 [Saxophila tyrrhenica]|uniref:Uncharacterized protein n=1 Tax=Saxophila tyrrhenica TaxID=1690608 RepID=A0AAV9PGU4_9PEZI|nr:hypothetical protein LTR77_003357 [Saxophila tyrrhenica]